MSEAKEVDSVEHATFVAGDENTSIWQTALGVSLVTLNVLMRLYCGLFMIISDCDETYNYWEPLNLIARGFGKQTWEYSPAYAIRSYLYLIPYYVVTFPLRDYIHVTGEQLPDYYFFYFIRIFALSGFTCFSEYKLFRSVQRNLSSYAANWFLLFSTVSAGMSHAGVAFLPSSFALGWIALGTSFALDVLTLENTFASVWPSVKAITCFLFAGIFGWPFTLALGLPFGIFTLASRFQTDPLVRIVLLCTVVFVAMMIVSISVDSYIYDRTMLFVPFNIVLYNVFSVEGEGPEIFGTEPFLYYAKNLLLNFNIVAPLGYIGVFINPAFFGNKIRTLIGIGAPLMIWTYIFGNQAHKEERFLYPIYPMITLSAAVLTSNMFSELKKRVHYKWVIRATSTLSMMTVIAVSLLRVVNLIENYSAPITSAQVFAEVAKNDSSVTIKNVCVGREWYHFPTSFFLPDTYRLRFIASGFDGLLPGDFPEGVPLTKAASKYPNGMNTRNIFSPDKIVELEECDFIIDNSSPVNHDNGEIQFITIDNGTPSVIEGWEKVSCEKIIRPDGNHKGVGKLLYIPEAFRNYIPYDIEYMYYCVLKKEG